MQRVLQERRLRQGRLGRAPGIPALGPRRLSGRVRIPVGLRHRERAKRAGPPLQLLQPEGCLELRLRRTGLHQGGSRGAWRLGPGDHLGGLLGGRDPALEIGPCPCGSQLGLPLGLRADPPREGPPHPVAHGLRFGAGARRLGALSGPGRGPGDEESGHEHGDQHDAGLRDDPARERARGRGGPLLPAAHLKPPGGVKRQPRRSSPIWSHPSPSTWRAM